MTLALDGTKILANASKHSAVSHGHAVGQMQLLEKEIEVLLKKAEEADSTPLEDLADCAAGGGAPEGSD